MTDGPFVHLHCHTHYSLLDGANRIPELVDHVKGLGMNAVAMTDHGNLYGAIEFYRTCRENDVNPIVGYEAYVAPKNRTEREARRRGEAGFHLTLLAKNHTGFQNLVKLSSIAFLEGYHYVPRIDKEVLEAHSEGLICLSGCASSEFSDYILRDQMDEARNVAEWFSKVFGSNFYIEIQNNGLDIQKTCADGAVDIANKLGLPLVATCDAHYLTDQDSTAHDVLLCINTGKTLEDPNRMRYGSDQFYVRAPHEMYQLFPEFHEAVKRSQEIADGCDIQLDFKARHFPVFVPPDEKTPNDYMRELCEQGLLERYGDEPSQAARDRLEHELGIITRMGFSSYFLIVHDFVRFALDENIPCTARGSACGSIVSYVLGFSDVDPLEYDLLFERFLDPNRAEAPDIDIDFCQDRRERVLAYVREKYGEKSVAQIATFGTLAARAAIKDVGRVLNIPLERVIQLTNMIPKTLGISIADSLKESSELRDAYKGDGDVRKMLDLAMRLEGTNRNTGTHAAGVVISDGPLVNFVPLQRMLRKGEDSRRGSEPIITTQWVMGDLEMVGMLKMDFLGLRTLTVLDNAVRLIEETRGVKIDLQKLPLDDPKTYALLQRGDAKGVFQLESDGIRELLKRLRPDNIRDIIALMALYRPGPLDGGMVDAYINCKHGLETPTYVHPVMEEVLSESFGVMCYQEQVMRILNRLGGIELSSAYACIKAISKKKTAIIDQRRTDFLSGAQERGVAKETAEEIFRLITVFGGYGFNKCVVGDTLISNAETGERVRVRDLLHNPRPFHVHALDDAGRLVRRPVEAVMWNGRKPVYRLTTVLGKVITATGNHPFRTLDGWTNLEALKPGDRLAVPRHLRVEGKEHWPRHELISLAGLLSEGNTCHPTTLYFYSNDRVFLDDFADAIAKFPDTVARIDIRRDGRHMEVAANTGPPGRRTSGGRVAAMQKPKPSRSGAFRWAERLGILDRKATEKRIPAQVFRLCDEDLELFLGRLWAGDGFIANATQKAPFYATSSRGLAEDVQHLLLRLGLVGRIHEKQFNYRGQSKPGYTVYLLGEDALPTFLRRLAPHCLGRENAVECLRTYVESLTKPGSSRLAEFFESDRLANLAQSDIFWDTIKSIEPTGEEDTYDLTVAEDHNFVADGIIVHNSHSCAYAQVGYQTAYLKAHYTPEFMAALLSSEVDDGNKRDILVEHIEDAKRLGVEVLAPNINQGDAAFTVKDGKIVFGLTAIKGCGRNAASEIARARGEGGAFKDIFDLCERIDHKAVTKGTLEKLIKAGAMDCLSGHRAQQMHVLTRAVQAAIDKQKDLSIGQKGLFDDFAPTETADSETVEQLPDVEAWPETEMLKYEKEVLDFYFSSHPLAQREKEIRRYTTHSVDVIKTLPADEEVLLGGMLTGVRFRNTSRARNGNSRFAAFKLEDFTGNVECVIWPDDLARCNEEIENDRVCYLQGRVERKREEPTIVISRVISEEQIAQERATGLWLRVQIGKHRPVEIDALVDILKRTPGRTPVFLTVSDAENRTAVLRLGRQFGVNPATFEADALESLLGLGSVKLA